MIPDTSDWSPARTDDDRRRSGSGSGWHTTAAVLAVVFLVVAAPLVPGVVVADHGDDDDAPSVPASYYGDITVNGDPAESGTEITAIVNGNSHGSIETAEEGSYGGPGALDEKLVVEGAESGDTVSFEVRGVEAEETVSWESGDVQEVDLTFEDVPESDDSDDQNTEEDNGENTEEDDAGGGGGGGGGAVPAPPEETEEPADGTEAPAESAETSAPTDGEATPGPDEEIDGVEDVSDTEVVDQAEAEISTDSETGAAEATFDSDAPVQEVEFETESQPEPGSDSGSGMDGSVEVTEVSDPPAETGDPPGSSTTVTDIQVPAGAEDNPATVTMRVSNERLEGIDATAEDIRIHRYSDGEWQRLETRVAEETTDGVVLEADTPGFSFFAASAVSEPDAELSLSSTSVEPGTEVTLDGSGSDDRYGEIVAYNWSVAGEALTGETASLALEEPGEYTVELAVTNDAGETNTTTATLVVSDPGSGDSEDGQETAAAVDEGGTGGEGSVTQETFGAAPSLWILGIGAVFVAIVLGLTVVLRRDNSSQERL